MIGFCPLASGSKGNCIYLGTKHSKILIDAGTSGKNIKNKLEQINVDITDIDAVLVTHEHMDHIQGLKILAKKLKIPIFANSETAKGIIQYLDHCPKFKIFSTGEAFEFQDLKIHPFTIQHDSRDPVAFIIHTHNLKLGFCTDLGFVSTLVEHQLKGCDFLYIEANHQPSMVHACNRPMTYKQRVLSRSGHLSNEACAQLLNNIHHKGLKHVYLAHLSQECNSPDMVLNVIKNSLYNEGRELSLLVADQEKIGTPILF